MAVRSRSGRTRSLLLGKGKLSPDACREAGTFVELGGHRVFFRREGRGPALLLIHGYPTSSWDWAPLWPELSARHDVIALDMLGFGESAKPRGHRYSIFCSRRCSPSWASSACTCSPTTMA